MKGKYVKGFIVSLIICLCVINIISKFDYSEVFANPKKSPDVTLYIHGEKAQGSPIFNEKGSLGDKALWAPGTREKGILRIKNNYSDDVKVKNLALNMRLEKIINDQYIEVTDNELYKKFAKNMELTVKRGKMVFFKDTIYDKSFFEMLYKEDGNENKGFNLSSSKTFEISKDDYVDLEYTVHMKEEADNDMQGLKATVDFIVNGYGNSTSPPIEPKPPKPPRPPKSEKDIDDHDDKEPIDINSHWAHDCIKTLLDKDIIKGYPDGTIRPENYITRAETAILIAKALKLEPKNKFFSGYIDCGGNWAKGYIIVTTEKGIFKGYPLKRFKPNNNITREEMIVALLRGFNKKPNKNMELEFKDKENISLWALDYIKTGVKDEIIKGYNDNTFRPKNNITRAEAFTMICKLLGYHREYNH